MQYDVDAYYKNILKGLCLGLNPKNILETGIRDGYSTSIFLEHIKDDGSLVSIDKSSKCFFLLNYQAPINHRIIIKDAIESLTDLNKENKKYDLILLDDWHSKDHVLKEIELCENLLTDRGLILIHDTMSYCNDPKYNLINPDREFADGGPYASLLELDRNKWEFCTIPFSHGITLLRKIQ